MTLTSKKLLLRLFTVVIMAATLGIMYPGQQASGGTAPGCVISESCGTIHQTVQQCYQQAICVKNCRLEQCTQDYYFEFATCITDNGHGPVIWEPCVELAKIRRLACQVTANSRYEAATTLCDRLYWEHCPSPE